MSKSSLNLSVQGLKGLAALVVFLSHSLLFYKNETISFLQSSPLHLFFDGQCSVVIFFAISGFFYYKRVPFTKAKYFKGITRKIIKIYPPYIIVTIIGYILCNLFSSKSYNLELFTDWSNQFWQHGLSFRQLLFQMPIIWGMEPNLINPPTWYLIYEVRMFMIMPIITGVFNYLLHKWGLVSFVILGVLGVSFTILFPYAVIFFVAFLFHFFYERFNPQFNPQYNYMLLFIGLILLDVCNFSIPLSWPCIYTIQAVGASIVLLMAYDGKIGVFSNKILVWLGDISYEFYLLHFIILLVFRYAELNLIIYIFCSLLITLVSAVVFNRIIERL